MTVHAAEPVVGPLVHLRCPRCEYLHADDYECIDCDVVGEMRCTACGSSFGFVVALCPACEGETAFTWPATSAAPNYRRWACACCHVLLNKHEAEPLHPFG